MNSIRVPSLLLLLSLFLGACSGTANVPAESDAEKVENVRPTESGPATVTETPPQVVAPTATAVETDTADTPMPADMQSSESAAAGANADVLFVAARQEVGETWHFTVTVEHPDTGWDDYADGWDVVLPDGSVARPDPDSPFTRLLLHPHEHEQPFTRSQGGIIIPSGNDTVVVRAHDIVDGFGGRVVTVDLTAATGEDFEVHRSGSEAGG